MNEVEFITELPEIPSFSSELEEFVYGILSTLSLDDWQMGVLITDDAGIRGYNKQWRFMDKATDVLSFVQSDGIEIPTVPGMPQEVGDIIISLETVARHAAEYDRSFDEELRRVVIHGILHLKGMDHPGDDYETGMLELQEELLRQTGTLTAKGAQWPS